MFINPFDDEFMMPAYDETKPPRMRLYRFMEDGTVIEAATQDDYTWICTIKDPSGKTTKRSIAYSEAMARRFVEEQQP